MSLDFNSNQVNLYTLFANLNFTFMFDWKYEYSSHRAVGEI